MDIYMHSHGINLLIFIRAKKVSYGIKKIKYTTLIHCSCLHNSYGLTKVIVTLFLI